MLVQKTAIGRRRGAQTAVRILGVAVAASVLAGCYAARETVEIPSDYRRRHQIGLREDARTLEVFIGQSRGSLNPTQRSEVLAFARTWKNESTGGVIIDVPTGTPNAFAASEAVREINALMRASGLPPRSVAMRPYRPENPALFATVRLNYSRIMAEAGPCGLWPSDLGPSPDPRHNANQPYWNLGCANQRNLAAMVAEPADLVQPRAQTPIWTSRRTTVFERYRVGRSPETIYPDQFRGTVSNVGR